MFDKDRKNAVIPECLPRAGRESISWIPAFAGMTGSIPFEVLTLFYKDRKDLAGRSGGFVQKIDFYESLYMSIITYTTVGYGDYLPIGWIRGVAALEALSGIIFTPLFLIALSRRYLRMR